MKYLWVEDFNGDPKDEYLIAVWKKYFCLDALDEEELILKKTLEDALKYINDNPKGFDIVLLDMNIPICEEKENEKKKEVLFDKYLKNIVSADEKNLKNDEFEKRSGYYIFLWLIFDLHFPKDQIAFLTAYYKKPSVPLLDFYQILLDNYGIKEVTELKKIQKEYQERIEEHNSLLYTTRDVQFSEDTKIEERIKEVTELKKIQEEYQKLIDVHESLLYTTRDVQFSEDTKIEERIKELEKKLYERQSDKQYYANETEECFKNARIKPPKFFSKPDMPPQNAVTRDYGNWLNKYKETAYYDLRRSIIEMVQILLGTINAKKRRC